MASMGIELMASVMCLLGWAGIIISCLLPMWTVTAFVGVNIVTAQIFWEGIWMSCVVQSTGYIQCKPYESVLALTYDIQASRALMVIAIATGGVGLILAFVGGKCTRFLDEEGVVVKSKVAVAAGAVLITAGLLCLIPTSWAAGVVVRNFYSAISDAQRREIGACLYIGWGAAILLILGGSLFIKSACLFRAHDADKSPSVRYVVVRSSKGSSRVGSYQNKVPSAKSHPVRAVYTPSQSYAAPSMKSQLDTRPVWENEPEQDYRQESEQSWTPSTKSQMKTTELEESEHSQAPSTKSQLKEMEDNLSTNNENEDGSNPPKTYI